MNAGDTVARPGPPPQSEDAREALSPDVVTALETMAQGLAVVAFHLRVQHEARAREATSHLLRRDLYEESRGLADVESDAIQAKRVLHALRAALDGKVSR